MINAQQAKALQWYSEEHNLKLEISVMAQTIRFTDKADGSEVSKPLSSIIDQYNTWKKEDQKARARARAAEKTKSKGITHYGRD